MSFKTLISVDELSPNLGDSWVIVDCRFSLADTQRGQKAYLEGHIPGAIYAHLDRDLSGGIVAGSTGRHPWPSVASAVALFSSWGIGLSTQVVAYDDFGGAIAARLWWMLRWLGHESVAVLNGGFPAWQAQNLPVIAGPEQPKKVEVFMPDPQPQLVTDAAYVESMITDPGDLLIDARGKRRYLGLEEPIDPIAGHIPGAINAPFVENLDEQQFFKSQHVLQQRFEALFEGNSAENTVHYCGSGVTAAHNLLAMAYAGLGNGCLYTESYSGWIAPGTRAVITEEKNEKK